MDDIDVDSPPGTFAHNPVQPSEPVMRRLVELGVPEECLQRRYCGVVAFVMDNPSRTAELVSAILPSDEEVAEILHESKSGSEEVQNSAVKHHFSECMVWLQWLMFFGEPSLALNNLSEMSTSRGVCGAVWGNNDIAYRCRTCEQDPTCAICVPCFQNGNHKDHDYSIIYTGGGCCDCGDVTAWKRDGFCSKHKGAEQIQPLPEEFANSVGPVLDSLFMYWKNKLVSAETIGRENPGVTDLLVPYKNVADELTFVVVEMLVEFCKNSESLLSFVSKKVISLVGLLEILVRAERFLSVIVAKKLYEMLLKLLGEPIFKYEFGKAFLSYYPLVVREAFKGSRDRSLKKSPLLSTFSVQIFTVTTLTLRLVKEMDLLGILLGCLEDIFTHCAGEDGRLQVTKWGNLYETTIRVVEDVRFVMSHAVVSNYVAHEQRDILKTWMRLLSYLQGMSPLKREIGHHIEEENENTNLPFVLDHSVANFHSILVDAAFSASEEIDDMVSGINKQDMTEEDSMRYAKVGRLSQESSACGVSGRNSSFVSSLQVADVTSDYYPLVSSVTWLIYECLRAIDNWLGADTSGVLSSVSTSSSNSNISAWKKTFLGFRKGKSIFGGFSISSEDQSRKFFPPAVSGLWMSTGTENTKSNGQEHKTVFSGEMDSSKSSLCLTEGNSYGESEVYCILSSSDWPNIIYDVSSQDVSVHIPMHRLLSLLLQKALRRCYGESEGSGETYAETFTSLSLPYDDFFGRVLGGCHPCGFSAFVMEHPLRNRVFCAEIHAGMWKKNGDAALLSFEWYRSVQWFEQGLELDLFLLQCCAALAPADLYVNRIVERFGLSDYLSLSPERSNEYEPVLVQEMLTLIIQIVQERRFSGLKPWENLKRELIHKLSIGDATRSQLVRSLPCDLSKYDCLQETLDTVAGYSHPSGLNQGMYSLRWMYWEELDLYHPRWNSRDLQVAEERYMRYCGVSALNAQLPKWLDIYPPLRGVARIATCKVVLKIIRAVLFYAVFSDKITEERAPDGILIMALHLLWLGLDICLKQREHRDLSVLYGNSVPILAFAIEEIHEGLSHGADSHSLLSLLVSVMRMHKRENWSKFSESDGCNISSLIESLLQKFAELDSGCMVKLQEFAPDGSGSDGEKRKAKAERQAAILEKMKADQSKFLSSINSPGNDDSKLALEESNTDDEQDLKNSTQDVCSLCHDPNSKKQLSFFTLLQKSKLLSLTDRGAPSWNQAQRSDKEKVSLETKNVVKKTGGCLSSSGLEVDSSNQLSMLVQNAVNEFAESAEPGEVINFLEFLRAQFPSLRNIQVPSPLKERKAETACSFETLEQDLYISIRREMSDDSLVSSCGLDNVEVPADESGIKSNRDPSSVLLGKYIATFSRQITEHPSSSANSLNDVARVDSSLQVLTCEKFGPADCDGVYLSSCGHAAHQGCLDRYLSSLRERNFGRLAIEGVHAVNMDQGEFLCPVCRRVTNSVLPSLPGDFQRLWKEPLISTLSSRDAVGHLATSSEINDSLWLPQALSLLKSCLQVVEKGDIWTTFPLQRRERIKQNLDSISQLLFKMYFPSRQDKFSSSTWPNQVMIMWDTLKYSLASIEIASRSHKNHMTPSYSLNALHMELQSSSGFILSLLLKIVHNLRSKISLHVLQRLRGIQLFARSICFGVSMEHASTSGSPGDLSSILKQVEKDVPYPDMQFWNQTTDPILIHDSFSSLMWVIFCLPHPFLSWKESLLSLVHIFYVVSISQAILAHYRPHLQNNRKPGFQDCLITDISRVLEEFGWVQQFFVSNHVDPNSDVTDVIQRLSFPYLRRCSLLWKLLSTSISEPFCHRDHAMDGSSPAIDESMDCMDTDKVELNEIQKLEKFFRIPPLNVVLKDQAVRSIVMKWLHHFLKEYEVSRFQHVVLSTPAVPFRLMQLPHVYQDLLERYIKQRCTDCKNILEEPALCLLCGRLCSPSSTPCCRKNLCQTHAMACGAGIGVFLLIKRTTILLQRYARQAAWPSPYLDAFGEEDIKMHRGKPLYLNEERYAALTCMVASHGFDQSSKVLGQSRPGTLFFI